MANADSRLPMGYPMATASHGVGTAASLSDTSVMLAHRTSEAPGCQTFDGTTAMILTAAALGAMLTGWIGALKHASTDRRAFVAHLMLTGVGMAGTIAAAGVLSSLTVR
jgi:hypothetical protein